MEAEDNGDTNDGRKRRQRDSTGTSVTESIETRHSKRKINNKKATRCNGKILNHMSGAYMS